MREAILVFLTTSILLFANQVLASEATKNFSTCLADTLNGKERKELAKWIFFSIAAHPEINEYSNITPENKEKSDKYIGSLIGRLLIKDCPEQLKAAYKENPMALERGFEYVGKVAMQELMTNRQTVNAITNYTKYIDLEKVNRLLIEK